MLLDKAETKVGNSYYLKASTHPFRKSLQQENFSEISFV